MKRRRTLFRTNIMASPVGKCWVPCPTYCGFAVADCSYLDPSWPHVAPKLSLPRPSVAPWRIPFTHTACGTLRNRCSR